MTMRPAHWLQPAQDRLSLLVFVVVLFIVGVVFGSLVYNALTLEQQQHLTGEVDHYAEVFRAGLFPDASATLRERAIFHAKWIMLIWLLGVTVVGLPFVLALDFLKGVLIGFSVGGLIHAYGWNGLLFALATIAPPNLIIIPALVLASVSAARFSLHIVKHRLLQPGGDIVQPLLSHTATSLVMLLALWAAAAFESYVSPHLIAWAAPRLLGV
jgi:stage II sporulation protein M